MVQLDIIFDVLDFKGNTQTQIVDGVLCGAVNNFPYAAVMNENISFQINLGHKMHFFHVCILTIKLCMVMRCRRIPGALTRAQDIDFTTDTYPHLYLSY